MTYLPNVDYFIYYEPFPYSVRGLVTPNSDGTYSIFLNSRLTEAQQFVSYIHEIDHIRNDDFYNDLPISTIESA